LSPLDVISEVSSVTIRSANKSDVPVILNLIRALAEYEKLADEVVATEEGLAYTLFGSRPYAEVLLAEENGEAAGFCLFFYNYSTFLGKPGLYIEDIFVRPEYRGKGIGKALFKKVAAIAQEKNCGRIEWWVLDWNEPTIQFYKNMGAKPMDEWTVYRLTEDQFANL
jgi:GNAT superfamily N-acetyltransferase